MRSVKILIAAGAASLLSGAAMAADIPAGPPPQYYAPPPVEDFGGWYLRGDIGMTNTRGTLDVAAYHTLPAGSTLLHQGHGFDSGMLFGLGVGYQFNNWFRADITGEYRSRVGFTGTDFFTAPAWGVASGSDTYNGGYKSWVALANAYVDLGTWNCITPFVGVGVGFANIQTTGIQDNGLFLPGPNSASYFAEGASKTNFAWAVHAGLSYRVTNNFTVELAYRYLDMGNGVHGYGQSFDGSVAGNSTFQYRDMTSHDLKLGVRWTCCEVPPPPPPLVTKG